MNALRNLTLFDFQIIKIRFIINIFVYNLMRKIFIDGDGKQFRPFISVSDIVKIYKYIIKKITYHHLFVIWFRLIILITDVSTNF